MKRLLVPGLPFLYSWILSLSTVGSTVYWQDSGLYLTAVREMSVLYPPGFVLYQVLCKGWTLLFFFLDFTLAVHLFSSFCASLAAAVMALACRDFLLARNSAFRALPEPAEEARAAASGILAGMLLAGGYTFWFSGIYAKGYALYYLVLSLILWRMIRAAESGSGRDLTLVAALIGLAWAAHPSAVLLGPAFILFVVSQAGRLRVAGILGRIAAAAGCALGPSLLLPLLASRGSLYDLGRPSTLAALKTYLFGSRFTSIPHAFGWQASRVGSFGLYLWEELLLVGTVLLTVGLVRLARSNPRLLGGLLLWTAPYSLFTILFKIEGQHDCWFVAAWLPLFPIQALGADELLRRIDRRVGAIATGAVIAACAVLVNRPLLSQKGYDLAEAYGKIHLQNLDPGAVLVLSGDDPIGSAGYLQSVKGYRTDIVLIQAALLQSSLDGLEPWYLRTLLDRHPFLRAPGAVSAPASASPTDRLHLAAAAFLNANASCGRAVFTSIRPPREALGGEIDLVPAGTVWKLVRRGEMRVDPKYWKDFTLDEREVARRFRRERGQSGNHTATALTVKPECYEQRLVEALLNAKRILAEWHFERGSWAAAARLFESILETERDPERRAVVTYYLGVAGFSMGSDAKAEAALREVLAAPSEPWVRAGALYHLGLLLRRRGAAGEGTDRLREALQVPGLDAALREAIERELGKP